MLSIAHRANLDPPQPAWLTEQQRESAARYAGAAAARAAAGQQAREKWSQLLAGCPVPVEVRPSATFSRYGIRDHGGYARHVVPAVDAVSARRRHPAGRALCETANRTRPVQLGTPSGEPPTCRSCTRYTAEIRPDHGSGEETG
jgi:hypothetical protein